MSYIDTYLIVSEDVDGLTEYHGAYLDAIKASEMCDKVWEDNQETIKDCRIEDLTVNLE